MKKIFKLLFIALVSMPLYGCNDKDSLKKAGTTSIKRFIYCVLIFFVPLIVKLIMSLMGIYGSCGIG